MPFLTELKVEVLRRTNNRRVTSALVYRMGYDQEYVVLKNFVTNYASIPRILYSIIHPSEPFLVKGAVIHDYLYSSECRYSCTRRQADLILYRACRDSGGSFFLSYLVFVSVRLFGGSSFRQNGVDA